MSARSTGSSRPHEADGLATPVDPTAIRPFTIDVPEEVLVDLHERIAQTRFPDEIGSDWTYGTDLAYLKELLTYWRDTFDWRQHERRLNEFDQYKTRIRRPRHPLHPSAVTGGGRAPAADHARLALVHRRVHQDHWTADRPSLPRRTRGGCLPRRGAVAAGYGFSDKPSEPGFGPERIADVNAALMARLGYERYGAQGGDFGSFISPWLAYKHPSHVVGLHLNYLTGGPPPGEDNPTSLLSQAELAGMQKIRAFMSERSGYQAIQGTKPQTLGYSLNDSPAGLASWLLQIFRWCDCDGDIESAFTKDELLTDATIYWATETITSSTRLYYEVSHTRPSGPLGRVEVPTAAAIFPLDVSMVPRPWAKAHYNITRWTEMAHGGHFAALEEPELLVDDLRAFFRALRAPDLSP